MLRSLSLIGVSAAAATAVIFGLSGSGDQGAGATTLSTACTVPGSHETIQAAVYDLSCDSITLTADSYTESVTISRSLALTGAPSILAGVLTIAGHGTEVEVEGIELAAGMLFQDDFESGDTSKWAEVSQDP